MSDWPSTWASADLGVLIHRIEAGLNVKCEERPPEAGERGLVKISAVTWGRFDEQQSKTLPKDVAVDERNRIQLGDLLISRANTIELVGASVIVGPIARTLYLSDKVLRLVVDEHSKRWINYALKTPRMRKAIEDASSGNQLSMRNLSQDKLRGLPIPLASVAEQQRIADKLDTVLARVDACRDRLARVAPLLKRFRRSLLAAATSGQLTEDWRQETEYLTTRKRFSDLVAASTVGLVRSAAEQSKLSAGLVPYLKMSNISEEWGYSLKDVVGVRCSDDEIARYALLPGDWLFNTRNSVELVGKSCVWKGEPVVFNNNILRARFNGQVLSDFVEIWFRSPVGSAALAAIKSATTSVAAIYQKSLFALLLDLPSIEEQAEIVRRVEILFAFADRLEARLTHARTVVDRLTPSLLAKAFRGELVPQDPNDEPASELLRRLAASQSTAAVATKRTRKTTE